MRVLQRRRPSVPCLACCDWQAWSWNACRAYCGRSLKYAGSRASRVRSSAMLVRYGSSSQGPECGDRGRYARQLELDALPQERTLLGFAPLDRLVAAADTREGHGSGCELASAVLAGQGVCSAAMFGSKAGAAGAAAPVIACWLENSRVLSARSDPLRRNTDGLTV